MDVRNLIDMANRIGDFFESMPDHEEALSGTAEHIRRFWEPRMRRALLAALDEAPDVHGLALTAFTREAMVRHRARLTPAEASAASGAASAADSRAV
ncbi:formate dehydrogenase subunit delta [Paraburkholderia sp.]|uniref:formate dehydrogenase subunit delta n=1 Tax=Paraburkholderia sp. TaxID=1926495 RepID=UPI002F421A6E